MEEPILFDPKVHSYLIPSLAAAHASAILNPPFMIATFLPPLKQDVMQAWWEDRAKEVAAGQRHIIMQLAPNMTTGEKEVVGLVALAMPISETGPFRGYVEKLIVVHEHRRKGIAKALMLKMEEAALKEGRTLLMLDAQGGSPAELVYPKLGYIRVGLIPDEMISPVDGSLKDAVLFYRNLLSSKVE